MTQSHAHIGVVAIGRNEGERLVRCLASVIKQADLVVYVDSGSTDTSVQAANDLGVDVVELDVSTPFTAARARNAGAQRLAEHNPSIKYIQFIDGDCEVDPDWLMHAKRTLESEQDVAVVCGRRRERFRNKTIYNRLCDMEWDTDIGETTFCGGDAMFRLKPFQSIGGFNPTVIAGEEPELCIRLHDAGHRLLRLDHEMTTHDAAMTRFSQWWKRAERSGHAYAEGAHIHSKSPLKHWVKQRRSALTWGLAAPLIALALAWPTYAISFAVLLSLYLVIALRAYRWRRSRNDTHKDATIFGLFCAIGKIPEAIGMLRYHHRRFTGKKATIIEYKESAPA